MSTIDLTGMTWQEKVNALHAERDYHKRLATMFGVWAFREGDYKTPHEAIKAKAVYNLSNNIDVYCVADVFDVITIATQTCHAVGHGLQLFYIQNDVILFDGHPDYDPLEWDIVAEMLGG